MSTFKYSLDFIHNFCMMPGRIQRNIKHPPKNFNSFKCKIINILNFALVLWPTVHAFFFFFLQTVHHHPHSSITSSSVQWHFPFNMFSCNFFLSASFFRVTTPVGILVICSALCLQEVFTVYILAKHPNLNRKKMFDNLVIIQHLLT